MIFKLKGKFQHYDWVVQLLFLIFEVGCARTKNVRGILVRSPSLGTLGYLFEQNGSPWIKLFKLLPNY
ncbi:Uncharacterised protein [Actinobacillus equuli]|nr:Uncharacterised protein [Actinobacillus equuli]